MQNILSLNPLVLAFVGDAVFTEKIRTYLVTSKLAKIKDFHKEANSYVCCEFQAKVLDAIKDSLTLDEQEVCMRARNAKKNTTPSHANKLVYAKSTELEAIIGLNHMLNNNSRIEQIINVAINLKKEI